VRGGACPVVVVVALGGGCFDPSLPDPLPPLACLVDDDCPELLACIEQRCAGPGDDIRPPGVVAESVVVDPDAVGPGDTVTVAFRTDEAVSGVPVVVGGDDVVRFNGGSSGENVFAYAGVVGSVDDGVLAITATLSDAAGNVGNAILGVVVVDATAPDLLGFQAPGIVTTSGPFVISFSSNEALASARCQLREPGTGAVDVDVDASVVGDTGSCTVLADTALGASYALDLLLTDAAHNTRRIDDVTTIVIIL
jgi:hypothetical protein